jgi:hypothetical protein
MSRTIVLATVLVVLVVVCVIAIVATSALSDETETEAQQRDDHTPGDRSVGTESLVGTMSSSGRRQATASHRA